MSQKYDTLPMALKYDIGPRQFLFRQPSSFSSATSNIPLTKPPSYIPMAPTTEEPAATAATTTTSLHRLPSAPRHSTDSDTDSIISTNARLIYPTSHHIAQKDYTSTIYPTSFFRLLAAIFLIVALSLFAASGAGRAVPAIVFVSLALLRILFVFFFHTPRRARWLGWRGVNLAVDFSLFAGIFGAVGGAFSNQRNVAACVLGWVGVSIFALAAVDTGRPTRIAFTWTLSLDFWTGSGALSLDDNWVEARRPEMGGRASPV
ncbi:hypothetical protein VE01_02506 [Pseudogymnoascus verrucosus]|uniref:Uncharacterized protein n=1 Tax=Pseudogymnoascus verrucosus TaxID=342668 RepID=A0A1B8GTG9_9PEZI|nr:uncharacterized protein VE01_02506 [Pseudogymnoascus verrucosus]OBT99129.1 hypothetical protein VE01_02506 [Pseudogymnoascus verrucosus]